MVETYEQALEFLYRRIDYERLHGRRLMTDREKQSRMRRLLRRLDDPHLRLPAVQIAGTKGKGSTSAMLSSILTAAGYRPGLFTSPHLSRLEERMRVADALPAAETVVELVQRVSGAVAELDAEPGRTGPTFFETMTAMAWLHFLDARAEPVILEVGLGGRLDATTLCRPVATAITQISRDHTRVLGHTLAAIAREKAGIVRPGVPLFSGVEDGSAREVIRGICHDRKAPFWELGRQVRFRRSRCDTSRHDSAGATRYIDVTAFGRTIEQVPVPLRGVHQERNAALAVGLAIWLEKRGYVVPDEAVVGGLSRLHWPLRIETLSMRPIVVLDAAHNWASAKALMQTLESDFAARRRLLVLAVSRDKDVAGILRALLPGFQTVILTQYRSNPRVLGCRHLARVAGSLTRQPLHVVPDPAAAWKLARSLAAEDDLICVTGSFFLAAELRELILGEMQEAHADQPQRTGCSTPAPP